MLIQQCKATLHALQLTSATAQLHTCGVFNAPERDAPTIAQSDHLITCVWADVCDRVGHCPGSPMCTYPFEGNAEQGGDCASARVGCILAGWIHGHVMMLGAVATHIK